MKLVEIFDKQFDIRWKKQNIPGEGIVVIASFILEDGYEIIVQFDMFKHFYFRYVLLIQFYKKTEEYSNKIFDLTKSNKDQFLIFAGVYQTIKEFLGKYKNINRIIFTAEGANRSKLYKKFIDRYAKKLGYVLSDISDGESNEFTLDSIKWVEHNATN